MEPIRRGIEGFLRGRYGYEGQQAFWVLLVPVLLGAILLVGWSLFGPLLTIPRLSTEELVAQPGDYSSGIVAEPRLVPKPKTCSDYANERQILLDEQFLLLYLILKAYTEPTWSAIAGFRETTVSRTETKNVYNREGEIKSVTSQEILPQRTVWDWLSLVGIPLAGGIVIAGVGYFFNKKQREREEAVERLNAQDTALQSYLDQMSDLLVNQHLRSLPPRSDIHKLGEARTLAALLGLDSDHKRRPLKLVYDMGLIPIKEPLFELENAGLDHADLSELSLREASVRRADLRATNLHGADLTGSDLSDADLRGAKLANADLSDANLSRANLLPYDERNPAKLSIHNLKDHALPSQKELRLAKVKYHLTRIGDRTHIRVVDLTLTDLTNTKLEGAILASAILANADLRSVRGLTQDQVDNAIGNHKTKLPDPLKHPKAWALPIEEQIETLQ